MWRDILIAFWLAALFAWLALILALVIIRPKGSLLGEALRILRPDPAPETTDNRSHPPAGSSRTTRSLDGVSGHAR